MPDARQLDSARLDAASMALGAPRTNVTPEILTGKRGELTVRFRAKGGVGCSIEVDFAVPLHDTLLKVLPTTSVSDDDVQEGMTVDVIVGDAAFDPRFHVEGAPSDVVRGILDDRIRGWLLAHPDSTLELVAGRFIRVVVEGLPATEVAPSIDEVVAFATRAAEHARQVVTARDARLGTAGVYRALPDREAANAAHTVAEHEVARLREELTVKDRRISRWLLLSLAVTAVSLFWILPIWAALPLLLPATFVTAIVLGIAGIGLDYLGRARLRRWRNRRRRSRFERKLNAQLPPGDF